MEWDLEDLIRLSDIARMIGVTQPAVSNYQTRHVGFPKPIDEKLKLWSKAEVVSWFLTRKISPEMKEAIREVILEEEKNK